MARAGVGLLVSFKVKSLSKNECIGQSIFDICLFRLLSLLLLFKGQAVVRLFHLERFQHIQDIDVEKTVQHVLEGKFAKTQFSVTLYFSPAF